FRRVKQANRARALVNRMYLILARDRVVSQPRSLRTGRIWKNRVGKERSEATLTSKPSSGHSRERTLQPSLPGGRPRNGGRRARLFLFLRDFGHAAHIGPQHFRNPQSAVGGL